MYEDTIMLNMLQYRAFPSLDNVNPQAFETEWEAYSNHDRLFNQIVRVEYFNTDIEKVNRDTGNG